MILPNSSTEVSNGDQPDGPVRLDRPKPISAFTLIVLAVTLLGAANFCLAAFGFVQERGAAGYTKIGLISLAAFVVAFAINKFATEDGAPQAAKGYLTSGIFSVLALLVVGLSLFAATYAGQTIKPAQALQDAGHGPRLQRHAAGRIRASRNGSVADGALQNALNVLMNTRDCEFRSGCISGGRAGAGPVTRGLEPLIGRAKNVLDRRGTQTAERAKIVAQVNALLERYREAAAKSSQDVYERRRVLEGLHGKIEQKLNELYGVQPIAVAKSYAAELRRGVSIAGRPGAGARLNGILKGLADAIDDALDGSGSRAETMPIFPPKIGVAQTFAYIGKFLPIAGVVFVIEALLPLLLWIFAYNRARWEIFTSEQRQPKSDATAAERSKTVAPEKLNGADNEAGKVRSDPIDGPHGWSGRSRFNAKRSDDDEGDKS